ncbi:uncharacterized protein PHACADRAFT_255864 [Phanerochaete carnosa HHB-10118-sp]|uniref:Secreted protein n=1 Tax=Phanerochaete carnosa (strain HHB-10118-sp) TaxID=650164 RepID=K5W8P6_PHACS|nr:uncharacterized protein PHACADRAFT_255864 [Phanerochaete carnosa HHB-10118-sp]EKM55324.1 hypothetical protein PHACADRAFT_255864 [Phanerochaete carnosa HHB-10118-sp]
MARSVSKAWTSMLTFVFSSIVVEFAKESRPKRDTYETDRPPRTRRPPGHRLVVSGISRDTSWQVCVFPRCSLRYPASEDQSDDSIARANTNFSLHRT